MEKLSKEAEEFLKNEPTIKDSIKLLNFKNVHLFIEVIVKKYPDFAVEMEAEISAQIDKEFS